jgi:hypothetical protein
LTLFHTLESGRNILVHGCGGHICLFFLFSVINFNFK